MSLFDIIRDKAAELLSGAGDKVTEATGMELPGTETVGNVTDTVTDTAAATGQDVTDAAQGLGDTAAGATADLTGTASDTVDGAIADVTDPPPPR